MEMKSGSGGSCLSWMVSHMVVCARAAPPESHLGRASRVNTLVPLKQRGSRHGWVQSEWAESENIQKGEDEMQIFAGQDGPADSVKGQVCPF